MTITQIANFVVLFAWLGSIAIAILGLRRSELAAGTKAAWALAILLLPYLGAFAFICVIKLTPRSSLQ